MKKNSNFVDGRMRLNVDVLKNLRKNLGLSQSKLADYAIFQRKNISIASIKRAELGEPVIYRTALQLASLFNTDISVLMAEHEVNDDLYAKKIKFTKEYDLGMVGRESELHQIKYFINGSKKTNTSRLIYIRGIAGIGKTKLFNQTCAVADEVGFGIVRCHIRNPAILADYSLFSSIALSLLGLNTTEALEANHYLLDIILSCKGVSESINVHIRNILGLHSSLEDEKLYSAMTHAARQKKQHDSLCELIRVSVKNKNICILIDDLHWADKKSLNSIGSLISETQSLPVVWVLTSRHEQDPFETMLRPYLVDFQVNFIELTALNKNESEALARQLLPENEDRQLKCISQAQGNPLFLTQLLLSNEDADLPVSVKDLMYFKINNLNEIDRNAIELAAALHTEISLEMFNFLLDLNNYSPDTLIRQSLLRSSGLNTYVFVHDLILRAIYEQINTKKLQKYHFIIANYYKASDVINYAVHLEKAKHKDAPKVILTAINEKLKIGSYFEALELLGVYENISYAEISLFELNFIKGKIFVAIGSTNEALTAFKCAYKSNSQIIEQLQTAVEIAKIYNILDELEEEQKIIDQHVPLAKKEENYSLLAQLLYLKGNIYFPRGDYEKSKQLHSEAVEIAIKAKDFRTEALALSGLGDSFYARGWMKDASRFFLQCLNICKDNSFPDIEGSNKFMLATTSLYLNKTEFALENALESIVVCKKCGNLRAEIVSRLTAGWLYTSMGKIDLGLNEFHEGIGICEKIGASRFKPFLLEGVAKCLYLIGEQSDSYLVMREALFLARNGNLLKFIGPWLLGTLSIISTDSNERSDAIEEGLKILNEGCVGHNYYRFYVSAAESLIADGKLVKARGLVNMFKDYTKEQPCPWADHHIQLIDLHLRKMVEPHFLVESDLNNAIAKGVEYKISYVSPNLHLIKINK